MAEDLREAVQIVGLSPSRKGIDLDKEAWGLPWDPLCHRYDVWFEMHDRSLWERRGPQYLEQLQESVVPIYMQKVEDDIPMSRGFPLLEMVGAFGDYFNSSIAYMLSMAIAAGKDIEVWGVDNHTDEEWFFERPCNEYYLGIARGRGLRVKVHKDSSLLRHSPNIMFLDERQHYPVRYGWLAETR